MSDSAVTTLLQQLHTKLESASTLTPTDRELLKELSVDIQHLLSEPSAESGRHGLIERVKTEVTRFEVSHPDLTATLSHMSKALSDMGI